MTPPTAPVCRADAVHATARLTASSAAFFVVLFLIGCLALWEASTVHSCYTSQSENLAGALKHLRVDCDNDLMSRAEREIQSGTATCIAARETKMDGFMKLFMGCVIRNHVASAGHCADIPLCDTLASWIDTFRKTFFLLVILCILLLARSMMMMWNAEKKVVQRFLEVRRSLGDASRKEFELHREDAELDARLDSDGGFPVPAAMKKRV